MSTKTDLVCDNCGVPGARVLHMSKSYGEGDELLVIENVPVISCPACGESYLTAATLREIDSIKRNRSDVAPERPVPVAVFSS
jgi:YgiT-type zinc finger domain-containing protein